MLDILRLVSSLSASERIYFRKHLNPQFSGKKKNHLAIYEVIVKKPNISIEQLKAHFKGTNIEKHFASEMNYLFDAIMKALIQKSFIKAPDKQAIKNILSVDVLLSKGLIQRAQKVLFKAKSLAYHFEDFTTIIKALEQEEKIILINGRLPNEQRLQRVVDERHEILEKIRNLVQVQSLVERATSIQPKKGYLIDSRHYKEMLQKPVFQDRSLCKSKKALERWLYTRVHVFNLIGRYKEFLEATTEYINFLKDLSYLFEPTVELSAFSYHLKALTLMKRNADFFDFIQEFDKLKDVGGTFSVKVEMYLIVRKLEFAHFTGSEKYIKTVLDESVSLCIPAEEYLPPVMWEFFCILKMSCFIQLGEFEAGMRLYDRWHSRNHGIHISRFMRVCKLILIFELDLDYTKEPDFEAVRKFLAQQPLPPKLQGPLLSFFRRVFVSSKDHLADLMKLETELDEFERDANALHIRRYFDFLKWCRDCISRKTKTFRVEY